MLDSVSELHPGAERLEFGLIWLRCPPVARAGDPQREQSEGKGKRPAIDDARPESVRLQVSPALDLFDRALGLLKPCLLLSE